VRIVGAIVALATAAAVLQACADDGGRPVQSTASVTTADPAATFAPLVHIHDREESFPMSASTFLDYSALRWSNEACIAYSNVAIGAPRLLLRRDEPRPVLRAGRLAGQPRPYGARPLGPDCQPSGRRFGSDELTRPFEPNRPAGLRGGDGFSLNLMTDKLDGDPRIERSKGRARLRGVPIYVERRRAGGLLRLTYWMLYGRTSPDTGPDGSGAAREGGWERVTVLLRPLQGAGSYVPILVRHWISGQAVDVPWQDAELQSAPGRQRPTHPVAFAALGTHAPYPSAGERQRRVRGPDGLVMAREVAVACASCPRWASWEDVRPVRLEPWYGYGGAWGSGRERYAAGSLGPGAGAPTVGLLRRTIAELREALRAEGPAGLCARVDDPAGCLPVARALHRGVPAPSALRPSGRSVLDVRRDIRGATATVALHKRVPGELRFVERDGAWRLARLTLTPAVERSSWPLKDAQSKIAHVTRLRDGRRVPCPAIERIEHGGRDAVAGGCELRFNSSDLAVRLLTAVGDFTVGRCQASFVVNTSPGLTALLVDHIDLSGPGLCSGAAPCADGETGLRYPWQGTIRKSGFSNGVDVSFDVCLNTRVGRVRGMIYLRLARRADSWAVALHDYPAGDSSVMLGGRWSVAPGDFDIRARD
jgi:hypothetical protein